MSGMGNRTGIPVFQVTRDLETGELQEAIGVGGATATLELPIIYTWYALIPYYKRMRYIRTRGIDKNNNILSPPVAWYVRNSDTAGSINLREDGYLGSINVGAATKTDSAYSYFFTDTFYIYYNFNRYELTNRCKAADGTTGVSAHCVLFSIDPSLQVEYEDDTGTWHTVDPVPLNEFDLLLA